MDSSILINQTSALKPGFLLSCLTPWSLRAGVEERNESLDRNLSSFDRDGGICIWGLRHSERV
jgi:hypothetical protein